MRASSFKNMPARRRKKLGWLVGWLAEVKNDQYLKKCWKNECRDEQLIKSRKVCVCLDACAWVCEHVLGPECQSVCERDRKMSSCQRRGLQHSFSSKSDFLLFEEHQKKT